ERVRGALSRLEELEGAVATARTKLAAVEQAALAKAFRGELVAQDPSDEPAQAVLERARVAGADASTSGSISRSNQPPIGKARKTSRAKRNQAVRTQSEGQPLKG